MGAQTAKQALVKSGLAWEATLVPVVAKSPTRSLSSWDDSDALEPTRAVVNDPIEIEIPGQYAVIRDSDLAYLGLVGDRYNQFQAWQAFGLFDNVVDSANAKYDAAGALEDGRVLFIVAHMPDDILVGGVDPIEKYLVCASSHDGSLALRFFKSNIRVVCKNTLNLSMSQATQQWVVRHTDSMEHKVEEIRRTLDLSFAYDDDFERQMNSLIEQEFKKAEFEKMVRALVPSKKRGDGGEQIQMALIGTLESSTTVDDAWRYTKYGALQAVAEYVDWIQPIRASQTKSEAEQRTTKIWFGKGKEMKDNALRILQTA